MKLSLLRAELPLHFLHIRFDARSSVGSDITASARRDSPFGAQTHVFRIAKKSRGSARGWMRPQPSQDSTAFGRSASHDQQVAKPRARCKSARGRDIIWRPLEDSSRLRIGETQKQVEDHGF